MTAVGARELKNRLGKYLRLVKQGTTILVTERGRPVAELRPLSAAATDLDLRLQELAASGLVTLPQRRGLGGGEPIELPGPSLSATLLEQREDRF